MPVISGTSRRCARRRWPGDAEEYRPAANSGWAKRTSVPSKVTIPAATAASMGSSGAVPGLAAELTSSTVGEAVTAARRRASRVRPGRPDDAVLDDPAKILRQGQVRRAREILGDRAGQLQGKERIPSRDPGDPDQRPMRERASKLPFEYVLERPEAQRPQHVTGATTGRKGPPQVQPHPGGAICRRAAGGGTLARHNAHRQPAQAAQREVEHPGGGSIQPLKIIDSKHDGPARRRHPQARQGGRTDCPLIKRTAARFLQEQHDGKSMALRLRQSWQQLVHHRSQKIGQGGEPELGLRLHRVRGQHHGRRGPRPLGRRQQHRRLADARFPRKDQSGGAVRQLRQQCGHVPELPIPPDHIPRPRHRCYTVR